MTMPRMRTLPKAIEELKKIDPDTALSLHSLQRLVKQKKIPVVEIDSRRLIDLNTLVEYLNTPEAPLPPLEPIEPVGIHPVEI